jgi:TRAP-type C4-dicarboxylate transport system substrate-binding protein
VQKYCALSNHCWSGYRGVANRRVLASLPTDLLGIVNDNFDEAAVKQAPICWQ